MTYVHLFNIDENCLFFKARLFRKIGAWLDTKPSIDAKSKFIWIASKQWWRAKRILFCQILESALHYLETWDRHYVYRWRYSSCMKQIWNNLSLILQSKGLFTILQIYRYRQEAYCIFNPNKAILFQSLTYSQCLIMETLPKSLNLSTVKITRIVFYLSIFYRST